MALFNRISRRFFSKSLLVFTKCPPKSKPKLPTCPPPKHQACKTFPTPGARAGSGPVKKKCKDHSRHEVTALIYQLLSLCVCIPVIIALSVKTICYTDHHIKRDEYKDYPFMGIRIKPFPWGDGNHSLFHNPCYNAIPHEGYEDDICDDEILHHITRNDDDDDDDDGHGKNVSNKSDNDKENSEEQKFS